MSDLIVTRKFKEYRFTTTIAIKPRGVSTGIVREAPDGSPLIFFYVKKADVKETVIGLKASVDALFAAGAKEVYPGCHGAPHVMTDPSQSELLLTRKFRAGDFEYTNTIFFIKLMLSFDPFFFVHT